MTATQTTHPLAEVGRRIEFTFYRELGRDDATAHPGVITALVPNQGASVKIRLDGHRSSLHVPPNYEGLTYLDEIGPVPELPMGAFTPTADDFGGSFHHGVPVCQFEDGAALALTADIEAAVAALNAYVRDMVGALYIPDIDTVTADRLQACWAVFEWEPEDSEPAWTVRWDAAEDEDHAIRIHYLPA